ncbi:MAG: hypothetical protein WCG00_17685, partial [Hyphomicrobiales bacterium]
ARQPAVFVSKADVRGWPVLGYLAKLAGTLFVRREKRTDVAPLNEQMAALVNAGVVVVMNDEIHAARRQDDHKLRQARRKRTLQEQPFTQGMPDLGDFRAVQRDAVGPGNATAATTENGIDNATLRRIEIAAFVEGWNTRHGASLMAWVVQTAASRARRARR